MPSQRGTSPNYPSHTLPQTSLDRPSRPSRVSKVSAPSSAVLSFLASITFAASNVHAYPTGLLDFLYPHQPPQHPVPIPIPAASTSSPKSRPRPIFRRATTEGKLPDHRDLVPIKYESIEGGWVAAEDWLLHGKRKNEDSKLVIPDELSGIHVDSITSNLDLPPGWDEHGASRADKYQPTKVAILALILACAIATTIGVCVWRSNSRRTRHLADVEKTALNSTKSKRKRKKTNTNDKESDDDDDDTDEKRSIASSKRGKGNRFLGKSSALWRANSRLAQRLRRRNKPEAKSSSPSHQSEPPTTAETLQAQPNPLPDSTEEHTPSIPTSSNNTSNAIISVSRPDENSNGVTHTPHMPIITPPLSPAINHLTTPTPLTIPVPVIVHHPRRPSSTRRRTPQPPPPLLPLLPGEGGETPSTEPPAYRYGPNSRAVRLGKVPIRGREDDYDERDMQDYTRHNIIIDHDTTTSHGGSSQITPAQPHSRRNVSQSTDDLDLETNEHSSLDPPPRLESPSAPPFDSHTSFHLATDDKQALARLHAAREDAPIANTSGSSVTGTGTGPLTSTGDATAFATVPEFAVVDQWDTEMQLDTGLLSSPAYPEPEESENSTKSFLLPPPLPTSTSVAFSSTSLFPSPPTPVQRTRTIILNDQNLTASTSTPTSSSVPTPSGSGNVRVVTNNTPSLGYFDDVREGYGVSSLWDGLGRGGVKSGLHSTTPLQPSGPSLTISSPPGSSSSSDHLPMYPSAPPLEDVDNEDQEHERADLPVASAPPLDWEFEEVEEEVVESLPSTSAPSSISVPALTSIRSRGVDEDPIREAEEEEEEDARNTPPNTIRIDHHHGIQTGVNGRDSEGSDDDERRLGMRRTRMIDGAGLPRYEP